MNGSPLTVLPKSKKTSVPRFLARSCGLALAATVLLIILSCGINSRYAGSGGRAQTKNEGTFNWRAYEGTSIRVLTSDHPWVHFTERRLAEFTELTGITVIFDVYPEDQFRVKRTVEMLSGITNIDAFMIMPGNNLSEYAMREWVEPLDQFIQSAKLSWPELDLGDFYSSALDSSIRKGRHYSMPLLLETSILAYNKRIFAEYGITVPKTMRELEAAARKIYRDSGGRTFGITMRGLGSAATSQWVDFLHSFGGSWLTKEGTAAVDSPEAVASLLFYGKLLREYGPRDATRNSWYESVSLFMRGDAGMIYDGNVFRSHYEDPVKSRVAGNVGYAMIPAGPAGAVPHISNWGLAIYSETRKKEAAWFFIQWATSKEFSLAAHLEGLPSARKSVWENPDTAKTVPAKEWTTASMRSYESATYQWNPPVVQVDEAREVVGEAIVAAVLDQDIDLAARRASAGLNVIISREYWEWPQSEH